MDAGTFLDRLEGYAARWRSVGGFLRLSLLIGIALAVATAWMGFDRRASMLTAVGGFVVWLAVWLIASRRVILPSNRMTVVVAFDVDVEGQRQYNRILDMLDVAVTDLRLQSPIRLLFGEPRLLRSGESAIRYVKRFSVHLVVWGNSRFGQDRGKRILKFLVKHTFILGPTTKAVLDQLARDYSLLAAGRTWTIEELNDLNDTEILAEDLLEITLAFIGYSLYLAEKFEDGVSVFRRVLSGLRGRNKDLSDPAVVRFTEVMHAGITRIAFAAHREGQHGKAVSLLEPLAPAYPENIDLRMTLARAAFYDGDMKKAVHYTTEIGRINENHPSVPVNRAFFAIKQRNFEEVRHWYDRLLATKQWQDDILPSVVEYLEERYREEPDEHAYLYGLAIVGGYDDVSVMRQDLTEFLRRTEHRPDYEVLRSRAQQLLN
jgi:tetratricopeptide (TPR) repeat protein